jgi:Ca-activated chloride channel family protein
MKSILTAAVTALALGAGSLPAIGQEQPNTILVLDASGSMWGQIDGVNKIVIAREVVADILGDFPEDQNLGFVTYGHRERGQCSDIQTVIEPAPGTAHEIIKIVNELNPRGMTPMTDAVIAAAQALRHTEQAATVILVSDGIETCNPDPCAAARALEQSGIDFTAHVIGFDLRGEAEALMQMQCIAEETGGRFLTADNAQELTAALQEVTQVALPQAATVTLVAQKATEEIGFDPEWHILEQPLNNPMLEGDVSWSISDTDFNIVIEDTVGNPLLVDLPLGDYIVTAYSEQLDLFGQHDVSVERTQNFAATALFPESKVSSVWFRALLDSVDGPEITDPIVWTITGENFDIEWEHNPVLFNLESGMYAVTAYHVVFEQTQTTEIAVVAGTERTVDVVFETPTPTATLVAPDSAAAGSVIEIGWVGPNEQGDNIQIAPVGERYIDYTYTRDGNPVRLQMPAEPGTYELRYSFRDREIIHTRPIEVTPVELDIIAPETAPAGSVIEIGWVGPNAPADNIQIGLPGERYSDYSYTREGNPVQLQMPIEPGTYELRYSFRDREIIHTRPIEVTPVELDIIAPETAPAGSVIEIGWVGPNAPADNIQIALPGERYANYTYTRDGNPLRLRIPDAPGAYELRYSFRDREVVFTRPITITAAE